MEQSQTRKVLQTRLRINRKAIAGFGQIVWINSMKKTKFKQRIVNASAAFFDDENCGENKLVSFESENNLWRETKYEDCVQQSSALETALKQVFLFFPGTFVLNVLSMGFTVAFLSSFSKMPRVNFRYGFIFYAGLFLAVTMMTWLGLGDVRKPKHLVIPASICSVGAIAGVIFWVLNYFQTFVHDNAFLFYVFPLALIAPFLAKGWVDKRFVN